ncbi:hypothetical protein BD309DRAFT_949618 [Dichomitus squalens]|uniref:Uncharacterized protein n=1 Tax=Dichomitus squalens TaxID=114155 RepID=A0A4Q9P8P4_9APHY|nr:hypothetical protein BD309DRAFT_949618 [Dichomitus squalens]TBU58723.1 hypothetical protein BD310DRAFT_926404 [Dichomitus squalens]
MSKPAIVPETTTAGIAVDPRTLERVIPESRRPDGSIRKEKKIRPGYTPQEDVRRFRGTRQAQAEANALPKGHIVGWAPPPKAAAVPVSKASMTKAQKKNEKRKEKRKEKTVESEKVKDNWEEDDDEGEAEGTSTATKEAPSVDREGVHTANKPNWAVAPDTKKGDDAAAEGLADKLDKLEVR